MHELHSMCPAAHFFEKQPYPFQKFGLSSARYAMEEQSAWFTSDIQLLLFIVLASAHPKVFFCWELKSSDGEANLVLLLL